MKTGKWKGRMILWEEMPRGSRAVAEVRLLDACLSWQVRSSLQGVQRSVGGNAFYLTVSLGGPKGLM